MYYPGICKTPVVAENGKVLAEECIGTFSVALFFRPVPSRLVAGLEYWCLLCPVSFCSVLGGLGSFDSLIDS